MSRLCGEGSQIIYSIINRKTGEVEHPKPDKGIFSSRNCSELFGEMEKNRDYLQARLHKQSSIVALDKLSEINTIVQ
jgi:hypothetical protein